MDNLGYSYSHEDDGSHTPCEQNGTFGQISMANGPSSHSSEKPNGIPKIIEAENQLEESEEDEQNSSSISPGRCGIFCWKPRWLQRFPTRNWFIAVFLVAACIKGMSGSYYPATISSMEKRLKLSTETIGEQLLVLDNIVMSS